MATKRKVKPAPRRKTNAQLQGEHDAGMTVRHELARTTMQALIVAERAHSMRLPDPVEMGRAAVRYADALINALNEDPI